jgi:hypothetical protein
MMPEQNELFSPDEVPQVTEWSTQTKAGQRKPNKYRGKHNDKVSTGTTKTKAPRHL